MTDPQTLNRYAYVGNRPLTFVDPLGLNAWDEGWGGWGGWGASAPIDQVLLHDILGIPNMDDVMNAAMGFSPNNGLIPSDAKVQFPHHATWREIWDAMKDCALPGDPLPKTAG